MKLVIIDYNAGNIRSVIFALNRIGIDPALSSDPAVINSADKIIFPGVGEAGSAMKFLRARNLDVVIPELRQPLLGICLGMQLLCKHSEEGNTDCLGIFDVSVKRFVPVGKGEKVPQTGWNKIYNLRGPLFNGIKEREYMYFVHGYYAENNPHSVASANYMLEYSCALQKENFYTVQFHPEKSAGAGEQLLKNFIEL